LCQSSQNQKSKTLLSRVCVLLSKLQNEKMSENYRKCRKILKMSNKYWKCRTNTENVEQILKMSNKYWKCRLFDPIMTASRRELGVDQVSWVRPGQSRLGCINRFLKYFCGQCLYFSFQHTNNAY
jgi:hypothetical protein